jgi:hypothetical protein
MVRPSVTVKAHPCAILHSFNQSRAIAVPNGECMFRLDIALPPLLQDGIAHLPPYRRMFCAIRGNR